MQGNSASPPASAGTGAVKRLTEELLAVTYHLLIGVVCGLIIVVMMFGGLLVVVAGG